MTFFPAPFRAIKVTGNGFFVKIQKVGVVGMGTMGSQIGIVFAQGGFPTLLCDQDKESVEKGLSGIKRFIESRVKKGKLEDQKASEILSRLKTTTSMNDFHDVDLVVEAVYEDIEAKCRVFERLDSICPKNAILATNTSTLSVTQMAQVTGRPSQCIGTHFLIPAALTPLVEIGLGKKTSEETLQCVKEVLEACGKGVVTSRDSPAFIINRLYIPLLNEAFLALGEGVASAEEIDRACVKGLGFPLGPLAATDASGLDVVLRCIESLHQQLGEKYRPAPLLVDMVKKGHLGKKTGKGVYEWKP